MNRQTCSSHAGLEWDAERAEGGADLFFTAKVTLNCFERSDEKGVACIIQ